LTGWKCGKCRDEIPHDFKHGRSGYKNHACRCDTCTSEQREYYERNRERIIAAAQNWRQGHPNYQREWRKRNPDKRKRSRNSRTCVKCRGGVPHRFTHGVSGYNHHLCPCSVCIWAMRDYQKQQYANNRHRRIASSRAWGQRNPEKVRAYGRERLISKHDHIRAVQKDYYARNRDYCKKQTAERSRRLQNTIPAPRSGEPWTPEQQAIVTRDDITLVEMCYLTGRSYSAVVSRRKKIQRQHATTARKTA
jgi:hypothetical protein